MMTLEEKKQIAAQLDAYVQRMGSQRRAAHSLEGVSSATISKILGGSWDDISGALWRSISVKVAPREVGWQRAETEAYRQMGFLLGEAQRDSLVLGIVGDAGSGKTLSLEDYANRNKGVYRLACVEHWTRKAFVSNLLKTLGVPPSGNGLGDMMEDAVHSLSRQDHPLLILDEADKLSDQVLYFFITLYNELEGKCGIVMCATLYLERRIRRGVKLYKKGYEEIFSRLGRKFVALDAVSSEDIALVCRANGVESDSEIRKIVSDSEGDMRRVKRAIWAVLRHHNAA